MRAGSRSASSSSTTRRTASALRKFARARYSSFTKRTLPTLHAVCDSMGNSYVLPASPDGCTWLGFLWTSKKENGLAENFSVSLNSDALLSIGLLDQGGVSVLGLAGLMRMISARSFLKSALEAGLKASDLNGLSGTVAALTQVKLRLRR